MIEPLNPDAPFMVIVFAQRRFGRGARLPKTEVSIYSKAGNKIVILGSPGNIQFAGQGSSRRIGEEESARFVELKPEFGKVVVKLSDSPEEPTFPTYEAFISHIA